MDIITTLPHDDVLFPCIFSHLSIEDLFKLRLVSTSFRDLVEQFFTRCTDFDLSKVNKKGNASAFRLMTDGNVVLQRLCLSGATHWLTDDLLVPVISSCSKLADVDLSSCSRLTNNVLFSLASHCHNLKSLSLHGCHWVDQDNFKLLIASNPNLGFMDVSSCWSLNDDCICFCAQSCPKLKALKLTNIYTITNLSLTTIAKSCPKLHTLAVNGCWRITNDGIRAIGEYCSKLRKLSVNDCRDVTEASLARLRVRGIIIDSHSSPSGALDRLETSFRHTRPFINLQV